MQKPIYDPACGTGGMLLAVEDARRSGKPTTQAVPDGTKRKDGQAFHKGQGGRNA
jgi:type I restriction-modification system DNA methylase subunit